MLPAGHFIFQRLLLCRRQEGHFQPVDLRLTDLFAAQARLRCGDVGLSREQIRQAQINGLEIAFLTPAEKQTLRDKVATA